MPLDIQPPNYSGLAAIASGNNNLNLSVPGALGLQAAQIRQQQMESIRNAALAQAQLQQQGQLALMENQRQRQEMAQTGAYQQGLLSNAARGQDITAQGQMMDANQNDIENAYKQQALQQTGALGQANVDIERQKLVQDQQAKIMAKLLDEKKEDTRKKGALAAYGLSAIKQAKTPEEAQMIRTEVISQAVENGMLTESQAKLLRSSPLSQFTNFLAHSVTLFDAVDNFKKLQDANKIGSSTPGAKEIYDPETGELVYRSTPTTTTDNKLQQDVIFADDNIKSLNTVLNSVPDNFFGASALKQPATFVKEWAQNIPGIGSLVKPSGADKKDLETFSGLDSHIKNESMQIIKNLSGQSYTDKQLEFMNDIVPQIGPGAVKSEFLGKSKSLIRFFEGIKQSRQELLQKGIQIGTKEYENQMLQKMQQLKTQIVDSPEDLPPNIQQAIKYNMDKYGYSEEEAKQLMKSKGLIK